MRLINPSFEIIEQAPGLKGLKQAIERAGRTCYKSEDRITEDSCEEFVQRMVNSGHHAMLEHGTVYLYVEYGSPVEDNRYFAGTEILIKYNKNKYSKVHSEIIHNYLHKIYITTNYRVLIENGWLDDLQYQCEPTEYHEKRITVKFILPISISREFIRHRTASFAEQSTRYCNYSKSKFNGELTFIKPYWYDQYKEEFESSCQYYEDTYMMVIESGLKAQEARELLPLCTKTELVMTAFISDWEHFCSLRTAGSAHPQARELATGVQSEFKIRGFFKN